MCPTCFCTRMAMGSEAWISFWCMLWRVTLRWSWQLWWPDQIPKVVTLIYHDWIVWQLDNIQYNQCWSILITHQLLSSSSTIRALWVGLAILEVSDIWVLLFSCQWRLSCFTHPLYDVSRKNVKHGYLCKEFRSSNVSMQIAKQSDKFILLLELWNGRYLHCLFL